MLVAVMSLLTDVEKKLVPETVGSAAILLIASASMEGMMFLQALRKFSMLFWSKSDRDAKLVIPS